MNSALLVLNNYKYIPLPLTNVFLYQNHYETVHCLWTICAVQSDSSARKQKEVKIKVAWFNEKVNDKTI